MFEIPSARYLFEAAIILPGKAVEWAFELSSVAVLGAQLAAAVKAGIVEAFYRTVLLADDQKALLVDLKHDRVAGFGQFVLARSEQPYIGPQFFAFCLSIGLAGIRLG